MRVPTMDEARAIWRRAVAAASLRSANPLVHQWHVEAERAYQASRRRARGGVSMEEYLASIRAKAWAAREEMAERARRRVIERRALMTDEQRREEWRRHQRAKRERDARARAA